MNGSQAKMLRSFLNPQSGDEISKKVYRKAKKEFSILSDKEKQDFIKNLNIVKNSK